MSSNQLLFSFVCHMVLLVPSELIVGVGGRIRNREGQCLVRLLETYVLPCIYRRSTPSLSISKGTKD